jgi:hypothetical protein
MTFIQQYKREQRQKTIKKVVVFIINSLAIIGTLAIFYILLVSIMLLTN